MKTKKTNRDAEEQWIKQIRQGSELAFEKMFKKYYEPLTRFSWRYVKSKAIAEELVQEVFSRIWADHDSWNPNGALRSYLYKAVKHRSLDHLKHKKVERKYNSQWDENSRAYINYEDPKREKQVKEEIGRAIDELPERSKMTFKLHRYDGLTYKEIAEVMDVSVNTVDSQMTRTLKKLREKLSHLLSIILLLIIC